MHHDFIDRYSRLTSPVHRLPDGWKITTALALILMVVLSPPSWIYLYAAAGIILLTGAFFSRIPAGFLFRRILYFEPFFIAIAAIAILQPDGMAKFFSIIIKSTLSLFTILLLANTTPFNRIIDMARRLRIPAIMVTVLALMYRYIFVLIDEMERISRARRSRTFVRRQPGRWLLLSTILGQLFVRSTERADRIYTAMCARGWKG